MSDQIPSNLTDLIPADYSPSYEICDGISLLCPVEGTIYGYRPMLGPNILFAIIHTVLFFVQGFLGYRMKGYAFPAWLIFGIGLEMVGWYARIALYTNVWNFDSMAASLAGLIIGPSFINAAISVTFKHIILYCGEQHSKLLKAKWYPVVFIGTDFVSFFMQAIGAGLSAGSSSGSELNRSLLNISEGILIAGVAFQLANMIVCGTIIVAYFFEYRKHQKTRTNTAPESPYDKVKAVDSKAPFRLKVFCSALAVAYICIVARCAYRVPEMEEGWQGALMQNETFLLVLDGTMIVIAVIALTVGHPMFYFAPMMRQPKARGDEKMEDLPSSSEDEKPTDLSSSRGDEAEHYQH